MKEAFRPGILCRDSDFDDHWFVSLCEDKDRVVSHAKETPAVIAKS